MALTSLLSNASNAPPIVKLVRLHPCALLARTIHSYSSKATVSIVPTSCKCAKHALWMRILLQSVPSVWTTLNTIKLPRHAAAKLDTSSIKAKSASNALQSLRTVIYAVKDHLRPPNAISVWTILSTMQLSMHASIVLKSLDTVSLAVKDKGQTLQNATNVWTT